MMKILVLFFSTCMLFHTALAAAADPVEKCKSGDAQACYDLGFLRMTGFMGIKIDINNAAEFFSLGCKAHGAKSCSALGHLHNSGKLGKKDEKSALEFYGKGCDLKDPLGCMGLGNIYLANLKKDASNLMLAQDAFKKACVLKYGQGCTQQGLLEKEKAEELFRQACDLKDGRGCLLLGKAQESTDKKAALELYNKSCELRYGEGCRNLALNLQGAERETYLNKACENSDLEACNLQGEALLERSDEESLSKALGLFKKACGIHSSKACVNLASMYKSGLGVKADDKLALENYMRGCVYGSKDSCTEAEKIASKLEALENK